MSQVGLLRIGEFSRASWLSIRTLRAYHDSGLLVPAEIDPVTGYRSYSAAQLIDATVIRRLRDLDVTLADVRIVLEARDPAVTGKVLAAHGASLQARLGSLQQTIDNLYAAVETPVLHTPILRRLDPARTVLALDAVTNDVDFDAFLGYARQVLVDAARSCDAVVGGVFGGCYPPPGDDGQQDVTVFIPIVAPVSLPAVPRSAGVRVGELAATDVAVITHHGGYTHLDDAYRNLGIWVATHANAAATPVREYYLVGRSDTSNDDELRTDICWPVQSH